MPDPTPRLITLAAARFGVDPSGLSASDDFFEALEIDSLQALDLLTEIETAFGVEVPDWEVQDVRTFAALAAVIEARL